MIVKSAGDAALLCEAQPPDGELSPAALAASITAAALPGVTDIVPGARTVMVHFRPGEADPAEVASDVRALAAIPGAPAFAAATSKPVVSDPAVTDPEMIEPVVVDTVYDGPDLAEVAALTGLSVAEVIERHQAGEYRVGWLGFSPGFGYLTGLDPLLASVPRLDTPRVSVPSGSVAIAGGLAAVYPATSPGGWRLLGRTSAVLWDTDRDPPAVLVPGARVRFRAVSELGSGRAQMRGSAGAPVQQRGAAAAPAQERDASQDARPGGRVLEVLQPGLLTTIQDLGRPGYAHVGVPGSGAADPDSLRLSNGLVGNEPGAACLEVTLGRLTVRFASPAVAAVAGAPAPVRITHAGDHGEAEARPPHGEAFTVPSGATLQLGVPASGLRSYLAVAGGIDVAPVLGSRSADLLSGLGPPPLRAGDRLRVGVAPLRREGLQVPPHATGSGGGTHIPPSNAAGITATLRLIPGPRDDWFASAALPALTSAEGYVVSTASNRTGLRLTGQVLPRATAAELPSEGIATGSLQVSHDGQPILLLADHPTTGGYPVIAVVVSADIGTAAQLRPGQRVRFELGTIR